MENHIVLQSMISEYFSGGKRKISQNGKKVNYNKNMFFQRIEKIMSMKTK